jgi:glycosyltransferase involved in cell wall biosynthesis
VEVLGDPQDVFSRRAVRHPLRPFFRELYKKALVRQCANAAACAYVTAGALQQRYPASEDAFTTNYSSVTLDDSSYVKSARTTFANHGRRRVICVGTMAQMYKGYDVLLRAVAQLIKSGGDFHLVLVGDGAHRLELEQLSQSLGLGDRVEFRGQLPFSSIFAELDQADIFVLPSRAEGLPRAMIEAMARGLPCVGTLVGGIPELLEPSELVSPNDPVALADKLHELDSDPSRLVALSAQNLQKSKQYCASVLGPRRTDFYRRLRQAAERVAT